MLARCRFLRLPLLLIFALLFARASAAQQYTSQEIGLGVVAQTASSYQENTSYVGSRHIFAGPQGRYTYNLSPSLAIEGSVGYLPGYQSTLAGDNGHELLVLAGVKAGWRGRRFGLYGKIEPGISSWSPGLILYKVGPGMQPQEFSQRRSNFTLDYGGVFEWYPTRRTIVRFDLSQTLAAEYDQVLDRSGSLEITEPGHIAQHLGLGLSIAHRFGQIRDEQEREPRRSPLDAGVLFALQQRVHQSLWQIAPDRSGGAWVSYNFSRYLSLDASA